MGDTVMSDTAARSLPESVRVAVIGGDGIGPEVVTEARRVLEAALAQEPVEIEYVEFSLGAEHWLGTGETLSEETLEQLRGVDAILFGAVGAHPQDEKAPSGLLEREVLLRLRFSLDHSVNLRPARTYPGTATPLAGAPEIDFVVVREGTEGPYVGNGGAIRRGTAHEIATETSLNTAHGVRRVVEDAFTRAESRRGHVTLVHKHNVLTHAGDLWRRTTETVAAEHPGVEWDYMHVDAATIHMVNDPGRFDVIVTDNLFGDILTDLAAAVTGGIGLAASASINTEGSAPSMFEPVHGSAPDIAGQQIADPTAAVLSAALMLDHLGLSQAAHRVEQAVHAQLEAWAQAPDSARGLSTSERGKAFAARLRP
ncbi:3-isopropylmalate dehydrogenase [Nesterenkonia aerolata]|uniref:3-isopropylmalate dehydrogenase n=1 Tax=Nesterenkonia aerolata TaxID=3074079 RepID=A0ABU2DQC5_9MICC|nr:3-isopropylmalate dehydrogenase [Nesterenkonia sp. LY-0111]MDR8018520.1 3-isopropylmalate dehydrogenase [Nesterenkonia sp. LY-0111]